MFTVRLDRRDHALTHVRLKNGDFLDQKQLDLSMFGDRDAVFTPPLPSALLIQPNADIMKFQSDNIVRTQYMDGTLSEQDKQKTLRRRFRRGPAYKRELVASLLAVLSLPSPRPFSCLPFLFSLPAVFSSFSLGNAPHVCLPGSEHSNQA